MILHVRNSLLVIALSASTITQAQTLDWAHTTGAPSQEHALEVVTDGTGSVITIGTFYSTMDMDPGPGVFNVTAAANTQDVYVQKVDVDGQFQWGVILGNTGFDIGHSVAVDASDNVIFTGKVLGTVDLDPGPGVFSVTTNNTGYDAFIVKLNSSGAFQWGRIFGGSSADEGLDVIADGQGSIYTVGVLGNTADLDPGLGVFTAGGNGLKDAFIQKLDDAGNFLWAAAFGAAGNDQTNSVDVDSQGSVFITGEFATTMDLDPGPGVTNITSAGGSDIFVAKFTTSGSLQWAHGFGGNSFETGRAIAVDAAGNCVFTGDINSPTDMDPGAGSMVLPGSGFEDSFVTKLDGAGQFQWAFILTSFLNEGHSVAVDAQNNVYTCGRFGGTMDIDPSGGITNIIATQGGDGYVLKYTPAGSLVWGFELHGPGNQVAASIHASVAGDVAVVGTAYQMIDVEPGPGITNLTTSGFQDGFIAHYQQASNCENAQVSAKVLLGGAYRAVDQLMSDTLRTQGLLPPTEPYSAMGFTITGPTSTSAAVLAVAGPNAITDWVMVELRDLSAPSQVVEARAALVQRDGDIVEVDGISPVGFCAPNGNYAVAVRHRNHLGVISASHFFLVSTPTTVDFTLPGTPVFGMDPQQDLGSLHVLWPGNVLPDTVIKYTGPNNDRDPILTAIGGTIPTATSTGYLLEDVDLDGVVKYTGMNNDRDIILISIGGSVPTAFRVEQLP